MENISTQTQVTIVGAGVTGLFLAKILQNRGIDCVVLENRNEAFLRKINRGGYLSRQNFESLLEETKNEFFSKKGVFIKEMLLVSDNGQKKLPLNEVPDYEAFIIDQSFILNQILDDFKDNGNPIIFEAKAQRFENLESDWVTIIYTLNGKLYQLQSNFIIGCDGYRGICRNYIPKTLKKEYHTELPFAWLEWISDIETLETLPVISHKNGFAMQIGDSSGGTRFYLEIARGQELDDLPSEENLWLTLEAKFNQTFPRVPMNHKRLDYMRSFYTDTLQFGRLFIAGDAAHQVPRFGSESINMAFGDAKSLGEALDGYFNADNNLKLENYTAESLKKNLPIIHQMTVLNAKYHGRLKDDI